MNEIQVWSTGKLTLTRKHRITRRITSYSATLSFAIPTGDRPATKQQINYSASFVPSVTSFAVSDTSDKDQLNWVSCLWYKTLSSTSPPNLSRSVGNFSNIWPACGQLQRYLACMRTTSAISGLHVGSFSNIWSACGQLQQYLACMWATSALFGLHVGNAKPNTEN